GIGARTPAATAWAGCGPGLAMAAGRTCRQPSLEGRSAGAPADAVRAAGVGPPPLRTVLGMGLPCRSLHARAQAQAGLLRAAIAVARPRAGLGQPVGRRRRPARAAALRRWTCTA